MTPQEKAQDLVKTFYPFTYGAVHHQGMTGEYADAKKCALAAVDQIILEQCKISELKNPKYQDERIQYWFEVNNEIKKL